MLMVVSISVIVSSGSARAATDVAVDWENANDISVGVSNDKSLVGLMGSADSLTGQFDAIDYSYERVEATRATGIFTNGGYNLIQYNNLKSGDDSMVGAMADGGNGFISAKTDAWRTGTSLKSYSWHGIWPGTDEAIVYAEGSGYEGSGYDLGVMGTHSSESVSSVYDLSINGEGSAGIGTWTAGSRSVLNAGGKVSGDILVKGEGNGNVNQWLQDVGNIEFRMSWN